MAVKILMMLIFVVAVVAVGVLTKRHTSSVDGFVLGGRNVGPWLSAFAYGTSYFSAVIFVGYAGQFGWKYGISASWIGLGNAILGSLLAWRIMGPRTREMTRRLNASTMPQFFGERYRSQALRVAAAAIIFVFLIPYTASVYNGLSRLFGMAFGLPYEACIIGMAVVTCVYVVLGGYMATVVNDFVQGIIMLIGIIAVIAAVLLSNGGASQAIETLSQVPADNGNLQGAFVSFFGPDLLNLVGVVVLTSLGTWGLPQMVTKFYAIKDQEAANKGAIISTVFAFIVAGGCYFLGGFGRLYASQIEINPQTGAPVYDSIMPTMLSNLPDVLIGIVIVLVLSASMSTLSSLVLTSSSTLTLDVIKGRIVRDMDEKRQLLCMRILLVVFVLISAGIALWQYNSPVNFIAQLMGISWGALAGAFLGPFLWGLYSNKISKAAVWVSFVAGVSLTTANMFIGFIESPVNCGAIAMLLSLVLVPLVSLITPSVPFDVKPKRILKRRRVRVIRVRRTSGVEDQIVAPGDWQHEEDVTLDKALAEASESYVTEQTELEADLEYEEVPDYDEEDLDVEEDLDDEWDADAALDIDPAYAEDPYDEEYDTYEDESYDTDDYDDNYDDEEDAYADAEPYDVTKDNRESDVLDR